MRCFLTGITGFIGLNLARRLTAAGREVHAFVRGPVAWAPESIPGVRYFRGQLHDTDALARAIEGCDQVFHVAGLARPWAKDPGEFHRTNVEGTVKVLEAALRAGVKRAIFTSSAATMSPSEGGRPSDEETPRTIPWFNLYESTKAAAEEQCRGFARKGLHTVIVNPSRVYGPGPVNPSNSITRMIAGYRTGTWRIIPGDGTMIGNYVFIDDVVEGHLLAAEQGRAGERYILGGENLSFHELFRLLAEVTGTRRRMVHLPLEIMTTVAALMTRQARFTGIPPLITDDFVKKYMNHWALSSDKAVHELGYRITPFSDGAQRTLEWLEAKPL